MKRPTVAELNARVRGLEAYQEAFFCMQRGLKPVRVSSGDHEVELLGVSRACGGVVIIDGCQAIFACDYCARTFDHVDPYIRDIASQIRRLQREAVVKSA